MSAPERVEFENAEGRKLTGLLHRPVGTPRATALFAHCFTCSKDLKAAVRIARAVAEEGIALLRFDFTGLGESEGEFAETTFGTNISDLEAAAAHLGAMLGGPDLLVGHSLGGTAALFAAPRIEGCRAVATIGSPFDPDHVGHLLSDVTGRLEEEGEAEVELAGRTFRVRREFLETLKKWKPGESLASLKRALLIFHSPQDRIVGIENARRIYEAARHPKSFVTLDGADHLLTNERDARYVGRVLSAWASRYLCREPGADADAGDGSRDVHVVGGSEGYTQTIRVGPHSLVADEPKDLGGDDRGPNPYDLLLAGLGACTSMTLRMYADRKEWDLQGVEVRLRHRKVHVDDCSDCETKKGKIDEITRTVRVEGKLDREQRDRLLEIADKCPVHRTLTSETKIRTTEDPE